MVPRRSVVVLAMAGGITFAAPQARADERAACADAAEEGQRTRDRGDLLTARERFVLCARPVCPPSVQRSCVTWLDEVEPRIPSIVVGLRDENGDDVIGARVVVDGNSTAERRVDGTAILLNPGVHELLVVLPDGRRASVKVVAREGEKARRIDVREPARSSSSGGTTTSRSPVARVPSAPSALPIWPALALAGLSIGGFVTYGVFDADARSTYDELQKTCSPNCSEDQLSSLRTKVTLSDVGLGVGIGAAVVAAGWLVVALVTRPPASAIAGRPFLVRF